MKLKKQYKWYNNQITKVFNRGQGRLALFQFNDKKKEVFINKCIANVYDYRWIDENYPEYKKIESYLGYPQWYFTSNLEKCKI